MPCENSTCSFLRHYKGNGKLKYSLATSIQTKKRRRKATSLSTCMAVCSWYVYRIKLSRSIIAWNEQNNKMNPPKIGDETFIQANLKLKSPGLRFRVLLSTRETCVTACGHLFSRLSSVVRDTKINMQIFLLPEVESIGRKKMKRENQKEVKKSLITVT